MGKRKTDLTLADKLQIIINKAALAISDGNVPTAQSDTEKVFEMQSAIIDELNKCRNTQYSSMLLAVALVSCGKVIYAQIDEHRQKGVDLLYTLTDQALEKTIEAQKEAEHEEAEE